LGRICILRPAAGGDVHRLLSEKKSHDQTANADGHPPAAAIRHVHRDMMFVVDLIVYAVQVWQTNKDKRDSCIAALIAYGDESRQDSVYWLRDVACLF
jgi:hypothetical protein